MASRPGPVIVQLIITYVIISFIVRAVRRARKASPPSSEPDRGGPVSSVPETPLPAGRPASPQTPRVGGLRREELKLNGVVWQVVHRPHRDLSEGANSRAAGDEVYVEEPPRCPKCGLGVVETHSWLGYKWACPECGTRARSSTSIEETARLLARRR